MRCDRSPSAVNSANARCFPRAGARRLAWVWLLSLACGLLGWAKGVGAAEPQWIWNSAEAKTKVPPGRLFFRWVVELPELESAQVEITCDNVYALFVNNERVGAGVNWQELDQYTITSVLKPGKNVFAVLAENGDAGPGGLVVRLNYKPKGGPAVVTGSGADWKFSPRDTPGWREAGFNDAEWMAATALGPLDKTAPWGQLKRADRGTTTPEFVKKPRPAGPFQLLPDDRVVWVGDTLVERASRDEFWEAVLTARMPKKPVIFRNLGWSGDTVGGDSRAGFGTPADGYAQLKSQVYFTRPTVIFVCYGAVSSFEGEAGLPGFEQGLLKLLDDLAVTKAQLVLVSPLRHEHLPAPFPNPEAHNRQLELYTGAIRQIAAKQGLPFVDLFSTVVGTAPVTRAGALTDNGVHLNARGYTRLAEVFAGQLGLAAPLVEVELTAQGGVGKVTGGVVPKVVASDAKRLAWTWQRGEWPVSGAGPELRLRVTGLGAGKWVLTSRGAGEGEEEGAAVVARGTAEEWGRGVEVTGGAGSRGFDRLRGKIQEKNQLYFHRWRPQNETYLFGFRKHEQGQNAKEIPQFDPLVAKLEEEIGKLKQPGEERWELRRE